MIMTTLHHDLPLRLLRAATAVVAAVLLLLGALTLQNLASHTDEAIPTLTGAVASALDTVDVDPSATHVDAEHGAASIFCALLGLAAMVVGAVAALAATTAPRRAMFALSQMLARVHVVPRRVAAPSAVSLTVLSIARV